MKKAYIKIIEDAKPPIKGSAQATCWDLYARKIERIYPWLVKIHLGVAIKPPEGYGVKLYPRSSLAKEPWFLSNSIGVGDEDYRGEYLAFFSCIPMISWKSTRREELRLPSKFPYTVGERCMQFEFQRKEHIELIRTDELDKTERNEGGFGSSGKL